MKSKWTLRVFSLARPFEALDLGAAFRAIERLLMRPLPPLEVCRLDQKRAAPLETYEQLRSIPWQEGVTVAGYGRDVEAFAKLWRRRASGGERTAESANYQSHEIYVDFPFSCIEALDVGGLISLVVDVAFACQSELAVLCPLEDEVLRQLYRERGLAEGLPDVFELTILGGGLAATMREDGLPDKLPGKAAIIEQKGFLAIATNTERLLALTEEDKYQLRLGLGKQYFAGKRYLPGGESGEFSVWHLLKLRRAFRAADDLAAQRTSARKFHLDWSGVFES